MFAFPVTIPLRSDEGIFPVDVSVNIDDVLLVVSLSDFNVDGVESVNFYSCLPSTEIVMTDGRKLPVLETAATINRYLDAYRQLENFYTSPRPTGIRNARVTCEKPVERPKLFNGVSEGIVVPLFGNRPSCDTSLAPTPD